MTENPGDAMLYIEEPEQLVYILLYFTISRPTCASFYTHLNVYIILGMRCFNHNLYVSSDTHGLVMELNSGATPNYS